MTKTPGISILLPVYNSGRYLEQTLKSLLAQSFRDFELVAVNDGSTDDSGAILSHWREQDSRIVVIDQENRGLVGALNHGLEHCRASLVARADSDDLYHPERLALQFAKMNSDPDLVLLGARTIKIDDRGRTMFQEFQPTGHEEIQANLLKGFGGTIPHPVVMFRKETVLKHGGYDSRARHCEDLDLWLKLSVAGRLGNLPESLLYYRVHADSICARHPEEQHANVKTVVTNFSAQHGFPPPASSGTFWTRPAGNADRLIVYSKRASGQGNHAVACSLASACVRMAPLKPSAWKTLAQSLVRAARDARPDNGPGRLA